MRDRAAHVRAIQQPLATLRRELHLPTRPAYEGQTRAWHNERTGEDVRVPFGIDPGWDHNVGLQDSVQAARSILVRKAADAPVAVAQAALEDGWDSYAANGRAIRQTIVNSVHGEVGEVGHARRFRESLIATLQRERGAGEVVADLTPALPGDFHASVAEGARYASSLFPRRWIEKANQTPLRVAGTKSGGGMYYYRSWTGKVNDGAAVVDKSTDDYALLVATPSKSWQTVIHEYTHHLQFTLPGLDAPFRALHKARTHSDPLGPLPGYPEYLGRDDEYIDAYFGSEYGGAPREVITRAYESVLGGWRLYHLLKDDPGMADLAIGVLMRYNP